MWIAHPTHAREEAFFLFRKTFHLDALPEEATLRIAAETRYRMEVNGRFAVMGPVKRGEFYTYFDTVDIAPLLVEGDNEITVTLLHMNPLVMTPEGRIIYGTLLRRSHGALAVEGKAGETDLTTDTTWETALCPSRTLSPFMGGSVGIFEETNLGAPAPAYTAASILMPVKFDGSVDWFGQSHPWILTPASIPPLSRIPGTFTQGTSFRGKDTSFVLSAPTHTTGSLRARISGKPGSRITLTYAESYYHKDSEGNDYKNVRDDESGFIKGSKDFLTVGEGEHVWESFYWRCFRFVKVDIEGEAVIEDLSFFENRYPYETDSFVETSDPDTKAFWDISVRTVSNCMHDSFEDCPYYEQLQYVMDSRLQGVFLRSLTKDTRLIRKCILDYAEGRFPDGMIPARVPSAMKQRIPGFALHYVFMLHDAMIYEEDKELVSDILPVVDGIFRYFERKTENDILGPVGAWSYVDWSEDWLSGIPDTEGPHAPYQFMLITALEKAAEMADYVGRPGLAEEYRSRAARMREAGRRFFYRPEKEYFTDSRKETYSMHSQIWAVLSDTVTGEEAKALLTKAYGDTSLNRCSYSMMFFVLRAYEKAGLYHLAYRMLDRWRPMIRKHLTTWVEDDIGERSDCHGWGAVPIYEFSTCILGVKALGGGKVAVEPFIGAHTFARGRVMSPVGSVNVDWKREGEDFTMTVEAPAPVEIRLPDGTTHTAQSGTFRCKLAL